MSSDRNNIVSLILVCRNEARHMDAALESLLAQEPVAGRSLEILVADGMSDDGTRDILARYAERHPALRVIDNPRRIVSTGLNAAVAASRGDIVLRMDAHTEYAPDYVRRCVEVLESSGAENVGGPARTRAKGWTARAIAAAYHSRFACGGARFHDTNYEGYVDTVPYGCWRRATLEQLGDFDENLVRNQDDEYNLRLIRMGGKIWQSPAIVSWYHPRTTLGGLFRQYFQYGYWKVAVIRKHRLPASWRHLVPAAFVLTNIALLLATLFSFVFRLELASWLALEIWGAMLAVYAVAATGASIAAAARNGWELLPALPAIFAAYHLSYGSGFLLCSLYSTLWPSRMAQPSAVATGITR